MEEGDGGGAHTQHNTTQPALSSPPPPVCQPWQRKGNIPAKGFSFDRPGDDVG